MHTGTLGVVQVGLAMLVAGAVIRVTTVQLAKSESPTAQAFSGALGFLF